MTDTGSLSSGKSHSPQLNIHHTQPFSIQENGCFLRRQAETHTDFFERYESRDKMFNRKLSIEKCKAHNQRIFLYSSFLESIMPKLKIMTEDAKDFLDCQEYGNTGVFKKCAGGAEAG